MLSNTLLDTTENYSSSLFPRTPRLINSINLPVANIQSNNIHLNPTESNNPILSNQVNNLCNSRNKSWCTLDSHCFSNSVVYKGYTHTLITENIYIETTIIKFKCKYY